MEADDNRFEILTTLESALVGVRTSTPSHIDLTHVEKFAEDWYPSDPSGVLPSRRLPSQRLVVELELLS